MPNAFSNQSHHWYLVCCIFTFIYINIILLLSCCCISTSNNISRILLVAFRTLNAAVVLYSLHLNLQIHHSVLDSCIFTSWYIIPTLLVGIWLLNTSIIFMFSSIMFQVFWLLKMSVVHFLSLCTLPIRQL